MPGHKDRRLAEVLVDEKRAYLATVAASHPIFLSAVLRPSAKDWFGPPSGAEAIGQPSPLTLHEVLFTTFSHHAMRAPPGVSMQTQTFWS
jgi:hypothetical protein